MPEFFANKADFDRAIQEALKPINDELQAVKSNRDTIIAEKRKLEGRTQGTTPEGVIRTANELHVPQSLVKNNPAKYQYFRKLAQDDGLEMKLLDAPIVKSDENLPEKFTNERNHYVSRDYLAQDGALYRREKAFAESKGLELITFSTASELPTEAFIPKEP